jgi:hypothetical protein
MKKVCSMKTSIIIAVFAVIVGLAFNGRAQTVQYVMLCNTNYSGDVQYPLQTNQIVSLVGGYQIRNRSRLKRIILEELLFVVE